MLLSDDVEADEDEQATAENLVALRFTPEIGEIWDGWSLGDADTEDDDDDDTQGEGENEDAQTGTKVNFEDSQGNGEA